MWPKIHPPAWPEMPKPPELTQDVVDKFNRVQALEFAAHSRIASTEHELLMLAEGLREYIAEGVK